MALPCFFRGLNIFGVEVVAQPAFNSPAEQRDEFFGLNGYEVKFGGSRGTVVTITGRIEGEGLSGFIANWNSLLFQYQRMGPLVDGATRYYPFMIFYRLAVTSMLEVDTRGYISQSYRAEFHSPY